MLSSLILLLLLAKNASISHGCREGENVLSCQPIGQDWFIAVDCRLKILPESGEVKQEGPESSH